MRWFAAPDYWFARLAFQRGLAVIYLIAFAAAARQFRPLLGERGLLPIPAYTAASGTRFTTWRELRATGAWWHRSPIRDYVPPVTRRRQDRVT